MDQTLIETTASQDQWQTSMNGASEDQWQTSMNGDRSIIHSANSRIDSGQKEIKWFDDPSIFVRNFCCWLVARILSIL